MATNRLSFIPITEGEAGSGIAPPAGIGATPPVAAPTAVAPTTDPTSLVEALLSRLELPSVPEPPRAGIGRTIVGGLGDAIAAMAAVRAGGAPPRIGAFAAGQQRQQEQFRAQSAAAEEGSRNTRNAIRIRAAEREQGARIRAEERAADERIRVKTQAEIDAKAATRHADNLALQERRVSAEEARLAISQSGFDDKQKADAQAKIDEELDDVKRLQGLQTQFDLAENSSGALSDSAVSFMARLKATGDPAAMLQAESIDAQRLGLLRGINLTRDKAAEPGVLEGLDAQSRRLLDEMDAGGTLLSKLQDKPAKPRKITDTIIKQVGARNAVIGNIDVALQSAKDVRDELGRLGVVFNKPLPQWARDPLLKEAGAKILPIMAKLRSDIFGATLPEGEIQISNEFIDSAISLDLDGMITRIEELRNRTIREQGSLRDTYSLVDPEAASRLFGNFNEIVAGPLPEGVPPGSVKGGKFEGQQVYITPDGRHVGAIPRSQSERE